MKPVSIYADEQLIKFLHNRKLGQSASTKLRYFVRMIESLQEDLVKIFTHEELNRLITAVGYMTRLEDARLIKGVCRYEFSEMLRLKIEQVTAAELVLILDYAKNHHT